MPSVKVTLVADAVTSVALGGPAGKITFTMTQDAAQATPAAPADTYVTVDGTDPVVPTIGTIVSGTQQLLPGVAARYIVIYPPILGGQPIDEVVKLISGGTPTVEIEW